MSVRKPRHRRQENFQEFVNQLGEAEAPPPPPEGGIPRQWLPGWVRWPAKAIVLPFLVLDLMMHALARKVVRPPYKKVGQCQRRGNCCHYILLPEPVGWLEKLNYFWNTQVNGFFPRDAEIVEYEGERWMVMGCRYLDRKGGCQHYRWRPNICRQWPRIEYFGKPQILKGCGFQAAARHTPSDSKLKVIQ